MSLNMVISGGQTGADQGGLLGTHDSGLRTGGTAPKGWRTEAGAAPWLANFGLVESDSISYSARTRANVEAADGTVLFGDPKSKGSKLTEQYCNDCGKPLLHIPYSGEHSDIDYTAHTLANWLQQNRIDVLNVAGNRESGNLGIGDYVRHVISRTLVFLRDL